MCVCVCVCVCVIQVSASHQKNYELLYISFMSQRRSTPKEGAHHRHTNNKEDILTPQRTASALQGAIEAPLACLSSIYDVAQVTHHLTNAPLNPELKTES